MSGQEHYRTVCLYGHCLVARFYDCPQRVEHICVNCGTVTKTEHTLSRASDFNTATRNT